MPVLAPAPNPRPGLSPTDAAWLSERTAEINELFARTADAMVQIGRVLIQVRDRLPQGRFRSWLRSNTTLSRTTAYRMIDVASRADRCPNLGQLEPSARYLLLAPSAPPAALERAIQLADSGERVTHATAKALVKESRPTTTPVPASPPPPDVDAAIGSAIRLILPDGGERVGQLTLEARRNPDGDLVVTTSFRPWSAMAAATRYEGRNVADVLAALAEKVGGHQAPAASPIDTRDHIDWAQAIGAGVATDYGFTARSQEWHDLRQTAVTEMVRKAPQFDVNRVPPGGDLGGAFRGWSHPSIKSECKREAQRLRNGGTYNTKRGEAIVVGQYDEGEREES